MKLLVIGDVVGESGIDTLHTLLRRVKRAHGADFVIVNGENAAGRGILPKQADDIFAAGADVVTLGNHAFSKQQIASYLDERTDILRPANLAPQSPGQGWGIYRWPAGPAPAGDEPDRPVRHALRSGQSVPLRGQDPARE